MIIQTHLLIANKIHEYVTKNHGNVLNKRQFKYGNIKPDIARRSQPRKHTLIDSLDYVISQIDKYKISPNKIVRPSVHIGTILHYISDFFCSQHYHQYDHGIYTHIQYERKLHKALKTQNKNGLLDIADISNQSFYEGSLRDLIKQLEADYNTIVPSVENDIIFALRTCAIVSCYLLRPKKIPLLTEATVG